MTPAPQSHPGTGWDIADGTGPPDGTPENPGSAVRIGFFQFAPGARAARENIAAILAGLEGVRDAVIVLPEFFLGAYRSPGEHLPEGGLADLLRPLTAAAADRRLRLVGSLPVRCSRGRVNRAVAIGPDGPRAVHDKVRLFGTEWAALTPGTAGHRVVDVAGLPCTVQICMDIADPGPTRAAAAEGAAAVLSPSAVSVDLLRILHRARAVENQVVSVFCNRHGTDPDGTVYLGRSAVFLPDGTDVSAPAGADALVLHTLRPDRLRAWSRARRSLIGAPPIPSGRA
ncbi:carbon-nitrogen hydrolase family protein [Nocardiopsis sp. RSe5-2]|uniref:Carbon-nitrogen hydrolase family protein n=1 Tax=Nocardiopsis endophytica TaxID=3018445 RepID=A0ABT4U416_9ACTN|nr:carbon-nitrogen hydrolase family protein [Nocardiopsis endophytica]MDA2811697.1 carbon-nitrogen hydrolase family protein [Nocardiopsis endophytica]